MKKTKKVILILFLIACIIVFAIIAIPLLKRLMNEGSLSVWEEHMKNAKVWLDGFGVLRYVAMLAIHYLSVLVAIVPGEPFELMMGFMFGTFLGLFLSLVAIILGTTTIYYLVNRFGMKFVNKFANSKKFESWTFLYNPVKRDSLFFIVFLIPGTPKDILIYFAPFTKIRLRTLLFIITTARIPSIVSSTYMGANLQEGDFTSSLIVFCVVAVVGLLGILLNDKIFAHRNALGK